MNTDFSDLDDNLSELSNTVAKQRHPKTFKWEMFGSMLYMISYGDFPDKTELGNLLIR